MRSIFIRVIGWGFEDLKRYAESAPAVAFIDCNIFGSLFECGLQIDVCGFAEGAGVDGVAHTGDHRLRIFKTDHDLNRLVQTL